MLSAGYREDAPRSLGREGLAADESACVRDGQPLVTPCASSFAREISAHAAPGVDYSPSSTSSSRPPSSPWLNQRSNTSTSLDADDEADVRSPPGLEDGAATLPSSLSLTLECDPAQHRISKGPRTAVVTSSAGAGKDAVVGSNTIFGECVPLELPAPSAAASAGAVQSTPLPFSTRRRMHKRAFPLAVMHSTEGKEPSPLAREPCGVPAENSSTSSIFDDATAIDKAATLIATPASTSGFAGPAHHPFSTPSTDLEQAATVTSASGEKEKSVESDRESRPKLLPTAAAARPARPVSLSPPHTFDTQSPSFYIHRERPSRSAAAMQQFGCCVFFFPAPLISWLFPLVGHVAMSNADGSRLYTFESAYYVREEKLQAVLDRVLCNEVGNSTDFVQTQLRSQRQSCADPNPLQQCSPTQSPTSPAQPARPVVSDGSASDAGLTSPSEACTTSSVQPGVASPVLPPSHSASRPSRRAGRSKSTGNTQACGHAHTGCVRIWDLKPLLMESRGRQPRRTPLGFTTQGGRQAAAALWERLQELLPSSEAPASSNRCGSTGVGISASSAKASYPRTSRRGPAVLPGRSETDVAPSTQEIISSSEEEERQYELLDSETARFFTRNLNATIRLFRGSADGSMNSPDVVLHHHSSFSFVGFVLEACGIGSQPKHLSLIPDIRFAGGDAAARNDASHAASSEESGVTTSSTAVGAGEAGSERSDMEEETHWGAVKILLHVSLFGKWHRGERRLWRAIHGGSMTSATILWIAITALVYHYIMLLCFSSA